MNKFTIHKPIWKDGRAVGIADHRLTEDLIVTIDYKTADGKRMYPSKYIIHPTDQAGKEVQYIKNHKLIIFKISELEIYKKGKVSRKKISTIGQAVEEYNSTVQNVTKKAQEKLGRQIAQLELF